MALPPNPAGEGTHDAPLTLWAAGVKREYSLLISHPLYTLGTCDLAYCFVPSRTKSWRRHCRHMIMQRR